MKRAETLLTAHELIDGDRAESYGDFGKQMTGVAEAFSALTNQCITGEDVALILVLLKIRRFQTSSDSDSIVDLCGYAALMGEYYAGS